MDRLSPEQRRKCMQANKSKGTKPELLLAEALWAAGFRYRKNSKTVFGKPDFSSKKYRIAIFVDGEFWHGKDWESRKSDIKSNREFWVTKIERNMKRDEEVTCRLKSEGWKVLRFWGKDVIKNPNSCVGTIQKAIYEQQLPD